MPRFFWAVFGLFFIEALCAGEPAIVSNVKVLSDKVEDMSNLETWKKHFIKDGMTDEQKAVALWKSSWMFVYQDAPPIEFLHWLRK